MPVTSDRNRPRNAIALPKLGPLIPGTRFRLGAKSYSLTACVCLYRFETTNASVAEYLVLTPDMRFAHVARPNSEQRAYAAIELDADEAREFLARHGEEDLVDDFPDLFSLVGTAERIVDGRLRSRQPERGAAH